MPSQADSPSSFRLLAPATCLSLLLAACAHQAPAAAANNTAKAAPTITVVDTDFSKGRLALRHTLTLHDLETFHGHLCDGLVLGFLGLNEAFKTLYPSGVVDRTNTRIVSKGAPCLSDAAVYLTGGRYQFNTFYVAKDLPVLYIVQRIDTGRSVSVAMNTGVKPARIGKMGSKAVKRELNGCELDTLKGLEQDFSAQLLSSDPKEVFTISEVSDFTWAPTSIHDLVKTDILNKNANHCKR